MVSCYCYSFLCITCRVTMTNQFGVFRVTDIKYEQYFWFTAAYVYCISAFFGLLLKIEGCVEAIAEQALSRSDATKRITIKRLFPFILKTTRLTDCHPLSSKCHFIITSRMCCLNVNNTRMHSFCFSLLGYRKKWAS